MLDFESTKALIDPHVEIIEIRYVLRRRHQQPFTIAAAQALDCKAIDIPAAAACSLSVNHLTCTTCLRGEPQ